jgi:hypothetical protein
MVKAKLASRDTEANIPIGSANARPQWLRGRLRGANRIRDPRAHRESTPRPVQESAAVHEVDAAMIPQNVSRPLSQETADAFPVPRPGMDHAAEALSNNIATVRRFHRAGLATIIARRRLSRTHWRARRIFNVHAHANRRAPPGRDPGRGRQREPDRGV